MDIANDFDVEGQVFNEHRLRLEQRDHRLDHHAEIIGLDRQLNMDVDL